MQNYSLDEAYKSARFGDFRIINYVNNVKVEVEFIATGTRVVTALRSIKDGLVKDYMHPTVCGVGYLGSRALDPLDKYIYRRWISVLERVYYMELISYMGCWVCDEWCNFQNFMSFYKKAEFNHPNWQLDKDLLCLGNKEYSPEKCVFIPTAINQFIVQQSKSTDLPVGVSLDTSTGKYKSSIKINRKSIHLGTGEYPEELFILYKNRKEAEAKILAEEYKSMLDPKSYKALYNYTVGEQGRTS